MADLSVVIPCYNAAAYIEATLRSVLEQSDRPREMFVIDDGSTDDSAAVVRRVAATSDGAVTLIQQPNAGESRARNVGIDRSSARFIAFLDADDLWLPEKTARQLALLETHDNVVGCHTRVFNFTSNLDDMGRAETERTKDDPDLEDLVRYHYVAPSTLVVCREALGDLRFEESVRHAEDMLFIADLRTRGRLRLLDEPLVAKRIHPGQQSRNPWHTVYSYENRAVWCRERATTIGPDLAATLEAALWQRLITYLEDRYWRRDLEDLQAMRRYVAARCPEQMARSSLGHRRIYPRWVYRLRDAIIRRGDSGTSI